MADDKGKVIKKQVITTTEEVLPKIPAIKSPVKTSVKKTVRRVSTPRVSKKSMSKDEIINNLIDNKDDVIKELINYNIMLQKKCVEMIEEMNGLNKKTSTMVNLFQDAARHIKSNQDEPLMTKLDTLLEQNRSIAKGLLLLEKYVREKQIVQGSPSFQPKPLKSSF